MDEVKRQEVLQNRGMVSHYCYCQEAAVRIRTQTKATMPSRFGACKTLENNQREETNASLVLRGQIVLPSDCDTASWASSPGRARCTAVWISRERENCFEGGFAVDGLGDTG